MRPRSLVRVRSPLLCCGNVPVMCLWCVCGVLCRHATQAAAGFAAAQIIPGATTCVQGVSVPVSSVSVCDPTFRQRMTPRSCPCLRRCLACCALSPRGGQNAQDAVAADASAAKVQQQLRHESELQSLRATMEAEKEAAAATLNTEWAKKLARTVAEHSEAYDRQSSALMLTHTQELENVRVRTALWQGGGGGGGGGHACMHVTPFHVPDNDKQASHLKEVQKLQHELQQLRSRSRMCVVPLSMGGSCCACSYVSRCLTPPPFLVRAHPSPLLSHPLSTALPALVPLPARFQP